MPLRRRRDPEPPPPAPPGPPPTDLVREYLRGQNLEQVQRVDEAVELYERAVRSGFDAAGPYDRLIAIYRARNAHEEVVRVAEAALSNVRTFDAKRGFYSEMRDSAAAAHAAQPDGSGPEF
ncbi:MAG TPA: hypothetical protein VM840_10655 [Actinomycetota bacterium]|nr:hypothetical protein [Actinomycetota bacterium]